MAHLKRSENKAALYFIGLGLLALVSGMLMGVIGGLEYIFTEKFTNTSYNFSKIRPLHVTLVISWIILSATGCIYYFLNELNYNNCKYRILPFLHFGIFTITGILILFNYFNNNFNGREYFEFPPYLMIPIVIGWIIYFIFFSSKIKEVFNAPIYVLMWFTGIIFMIITLSESSLYQIDFFGKTIIKDLTNQWKSNGALVGCWNLLVYGSATYIMQSISTEKNNKANNLTFWLFILGFSNLLFNWGHHIFIVPTSSWIRIVSYAISMTELILLARIIFLWNAKFKLSSSQDFKITNWFLLSSEYWIFLNLSLAIVMSVPAFNLYTHGTYVTVAHSMGTTIGINTTILLACIFYILEKQGKTISTNKSVLTYVYIFNFSLLTFWISLIIAGFTKGYFMNHSSLEFQQIIQKLIPYFILFFVAGSILFFSISRFAISIFNQLILKSK